MSAFQVTNGTIDKILDGVYGLSRNSFVSKLIGDTKDGYLRSYDIKNFDDLSRLGRDFLAMNADAVQQRYRDHEPEDVEEYEYNISFGNTSLVESYKAANCLHYQCCEGDVPERKLFAALETIIDNLASRIISELPEYDAAPWDSPPRGEARKVLRIA